MTFEWDENRNQLNIQKHGLSFDEAQEAFFDERRIILSDEQHSENEKRYSCLKKCKRGIATVRFTVRRGNIRILGASYWREGKRRYEQENGL